MLRPFKENNSAAATRFATGFYQPLIVTSLHETEDTMHSTLPQIDSEDDVVSAAKSSDDGRALIVRLFDTSHTGGKVSLHWPGWHPARLFLSNTGGEPLSKTSDEITIARYGRVMLRAEFE